MYAAAIFVAIALRHVAKTRSRPRGWEIGDWLINYSGGFIRRGLLGEAILRGADALHLGGRAPVLVPVVLLQLVCYGLLFFVAARLLLRSSASPALLLLFFSPAFLSFPLLTVGGGFRKEILHFGLVAAEALVLARPAPSRTARRALLIAIPALLPVFVLSHEMLFVVVPYHVAVGWLLLERRRLSTWVAWSGVVALASGCAFLLAVVFPGSAAHSQRVCGVLLARGLQPSVCNAAIEWLGVTAAGARSGVASMVRAPGFVWRSLLAFVVAGAPLLAVARRLSARARVGGMARAVFAAFAASAALTVAIMVVGQDWGRFLHVHVVTLTLLFLALDVLARADSPADRPTAAPGGQQDVALDLTGVARRSPARRAALVVAVVLYATAWSVRHVGPVLGPSVVGLALEEWRPRPPG